MPTHSDIQHSPYTPMQIFALVADVERYPEFLPWCRASRILKRESENVFLAELLISFMNVTESYVSRVTLHPCAYPKGECAVEAAMVSGPFKHLTNAWHFKPTPAGGTEIQFFLDFAFRSAMLEKLIGGLFERAEAKLADAFRKRAETIYGSGAALASPA